MISSVFDSPSHSRVWLRNHQKSIADTIVWAAHFCGPPHCTNSFVNFYLTADNLKNCFPSGDKVKFFGLFWTFFAELGHFCGQGAIL